MMDIQDDHPLPLPLSLPLSLLPAILRRDNILVPVKIDITAVGARYVDTFCWNINVDVAETHSDLKYVAFATQVCSDVNLPNIFLTKIALQLSEQVDAFKIIIDILKRCFHVNNIPSIDKLRKSISMEVGIRLNTLDYSDKFVWDPMDHRITPEQFASITCSDLGLPSQMEPAISHKIRELLFRHMMLWLDDPYGYEPTDTITDVNDSTLTPSETKVTLIPQLQAVDMVHSLWKRAKPQSTEEISSIPQPLLPSNKETNASIWK